ncbi:tyrosine-type recombinase/integrase [Clostridium sp.]
MNDNTTIETLAEKIVTDFEETLVVDGKAHKTIESYTGDIRVFLEWIELKGNIFTGILKRFHITSYRNYLVKEDYEINTINKKINSLHSFNQFLMDKKYITEQIVDLRKDKVKIAAGSEKEVEVFIDDEVEKLLFYIQSDEVSSRDRLIILLLLYTGVRVSELVNVKLRDVDMLAMNLTVAWGKGGKRREVPLKGEVIDAVKEYLEGERRNNKFANSEYLILTNRSSKMDRDAVNRLLKKMESKLIIKMQPHKFRHTFCTRLLKRGVELTTVAKLAGHSSIQTTASFYINTSSKDKRKAVELL